MSFRISSTWVAISSARSPSACVSVSAGSTFHSALATRFRKNRTPAATIDTLARISLKVSYRCRPVSLLSDSISWTLPL